MVAADPVNWTHEEASRIVQARLEAGEPGVDYRAAMDPVKFLQDEALRQATADDSNPGNFDPDLWVGFDDMRPPDGDRPDPIDAFWTSRESLSRIHDFARARRVAPWATFGGVIARVVTSTKPFVQLPAIVGSYASLNLPIGLVGPSGAGKDAAGKVAEELVDGVADFLEVPLGSGEGIAHMFMREESGKPVLHNDTALVTVGEVDTLTALVKRQASTVLAQVRHAAMGEKLGFFYVDTSKRMIVPAHTYRLCMLVNIQPERARGLLDDAGGGTPQRFVWLPATDPQAPDVPPDEPAPLQWIVPAWNRIPAIRRGGMDRVIMPVCDKAADLVRETRLKRLRNQGDALDGHALLTRLKVAAALAILEGCTSVSEEDWNLSGLVMQMSDRTRGNVQKVLTDEQREQTRKQAEAKAVEAIVVEERVGEAAVRRVATSLKRTLAHAGDWVSHGDLRKTLASRDRAQHFEPAMAALVLAGEVDEEKTEYHGKTGQRYRLSRGHS